MAMEVEVSVTGLNFPFLQPVRRRFGPDALFFEAGNIERQLLAKQVTLDITDKEKQQIQSMEDWGSRYNNLLGDLVLRALLFCLNGDIFYECLVEGCDAKLKSYKNRQQHMVDKHKFPSSFEFFKKSRPSKKQRQKTQRKQAVHKTEDASTAMQVDQENIDSLVSAVSRLSTSESPSSISFGRRHTRGLTFVPRAVQKEKRPGQSSEQPKR
ncbi:hypothetical protein SASPL_125342 [Salvia splendens]|uniref:C2H2-type domain-containing protein n=1 Tax=Salvia splendens TaxID=180675 RepID=A0A8X8XFQ3_SALSN|nr:hypothetical protein SASPL_125342 [Salvia splendens]